MKIQITIEALQRILNEAKIKTATDSSLSQTLVLECMEQAETHNGSDRIKASIKSSYQGCNDIVLSTLSFKVV